MKLRKRALLLALCLCLSACGGAPAERPEEPAGTEALTAGLPPAPGAPEGGGQALSLDPDEEPTVFLCRIVDGAESFPARLGEVYSVSAWSRGQGRNLMGTTYDLCGLYLQVLDDLWQKDPGLNDGIAMAGLDLSRAPGELTESEKAALAWRFGEMHGVEVVTGTFEELEEQGYFAASAVSTPAPADGEDSPLWYQWEDGCLFSIAFNEEHEGEMYSLPVIFFNAEKWRSPLGAYCFYDCSAMWAQAGTWGGYQIGGEMIS